MKKGRLIAVMLTVAAALALAAGALSGWAERAGENRLPDGLTVAGFPVGGLPAETALARLDARVQELEAIRVAGTVPGRTSREDARGRGKPAPAAEPLPTLRQLGMRLDVSDAAAAIRRFGAASRRQRIWLRWRMPSAWGMTVTWDDGALRRTAERAWADAVRVEPRNAIRTINARDEVVYKPEAAGRKLDLEALAALVKRAAPQTLAPGATGKAAGEAAGTAEDKGPHPPVIFLELPVADIPPQVTLAQLKAEGIERKIAEFTTSFAASGPGRAHNITAAARVLDGTTLAPDEIFSYAPIVEKAGEMFGYRQAPVIVNGELVPGVGGGICQVSSTLYNAVLLAGLDIVERRNHSLAVNYLPPGRDATFAYGYVDFRFRNTTGKYLLVKTVVKDRQLTVKLFGTMPENVAYRLETRRIAEHPYRTVYVADERVPAGGERLLQRGEPGLVVEAYRIRLVNGRETGRELLSRDTYRPIDERVAVHPRDPRLASGDGTETGRTPQGDRPPHPPQTERAPDNDPAPAPSPSPSAPPPKHPFPLPPAGEGPVEPV